MASIKKESTRSKRLSYKIRVCLGRDESGRQISKAMRWNPPEGMTPAKAKKEVQRLAAVWETEQKEAFERQKPQKEGRKTDYIFGQFVDEVWIPLCVRDGSHRPSMIVMYTNILKVMHPYSEERLLNKISDIQTTRYLEMYLEIRWVLVLYCRCDTNLIFASQYRECVFTILVKTHSPFCHSL